MSIEDDLLETANRVSSRVLGKNIFEIGAAIMNVTRYGGLAAARDEALRWSRNVSFAFTGGPGDPVAEEQAHGSRNEGPADALRHACLAALITRDCGYTTALEILTAHEMDGNFGSLASQMDLHNNAAGMATGLRRPGASDTDLQVEVLDAFLHGRLLVHDKAQGRLAPANRSPSAAARPRPGRAPAASTGPGKSLDFGRGAALAGSRPGVVTWPQQIVRLGRGRGARPSSAPGGDNPAPAIACFGAGRSARPVVRPRGVNRPRQSFLRRWGRLPGRPPPRLQPAPANRPSGRWARRPSGRPAPAVSTLRPFFAGPAPPSPM